MLSVSARACFVSVALVACLVSASRGGDAEARLRQLAEELSGPIRLPEGPIRLEVRTTIGTMRPLATIEAEYGAVKDLVDHPSRRRLESELRWFHSPLDLHRVLWSDGPATWRLEEPLATRFVVYGESRGVRWCRSDSGEHGQLTLTGAGVPFPQHYDFETPRRVFFSDLRSLANRGVPEADFEPSSVVARSTTDNAPWAMTLAHAVGTRIELDGVWRDDAPVVSTVRSFSHADPADLLQEVRFDGVFEAIPTWAARAEVITPDQRITTIDAIAFERVAAREVAEQAGAPDPDDVLGIGPGHRVADHLDASWLAERDPGRSLPTLVSFEPGEIAWRIDRERPGPAANTERTSRRATALDPAPSGEKHSATATTWVWGVGAGIGVALIGGVVWVYAKRAAP